MVVDAVMNPIIGSLTDGWRSRFGRRLPLMAASLLPLVLLFILMFALPAGLSHGALAIWVAILSSALRICMSVFILRSEEHTSELQSLMRISYAVFCLTKKITTYSYARLDTH